MRIAVWHALPSGGALRLLGDQLSGLAARGHELHLWSPPSAHQPSAATLTSSRHVVPLAAPATRSGTRDLRAAWSGVVPDRVAYEAHCARCASEIAEMEPDVVLAHTGDSFWPSAIARYLDSPSVSYIHEPNRRLFEAGFGFPWVARHGSRGRMGIGSLRRFAAELARVETFRIEVRDETEWVLAFDEVLVNSAFSREALMRAYGRAARVCRPGIDTDRFALQVRPVDVGSTVVSVGALVDAKRPELLVEGVAAARSVERFVWVANHVEAQCRTRVERAVERTGVTFELRHGVSDDELVSAYREADVFVYAPRLEPFGLAPLEANATGLPVVAVAEGGVRETVLDGVNGVLTDPDPDAFGAVLADLLGDPGRVRGLGRAARDHVVAHWSLARAIDELETHLVRVSGR
jgi:glycosyltransferase involved in cell wall biosynthesis